MRAALHPFWNRTRQHVGPFLGQRAPVAGRAKARQDVALTVSVNRANYLADRLADQLTRCILANAAMARTDQRMRKMGASNGVAFQKFLKDFCG